MQGPGFDHQHHTHTQKTYLIKDNYPKFTKTSYNSTIKKKESNLKKWVNDLSRHFTKEDEQIENKQSKMSYVIRELQITTIRNHYTLLEWPRPRTLTTPNVSNELSYIADGKAKCYTHFGTQFGIFLQN
jgi:hypothetical protein